MKNFWNNHLNFILYLYILFFNFFIWDIKISDTFFFTFSGWPGSTHVNRNWLLSPVNPQEGFDSYVFFCLQPRVNDFLHTIYITQFKFNCTGGSRYVAGWSIFFFNVKKKYQGDVNIFEKRKEIWVWSLTRMSLISLTNLITWLENHILITNKAEKKKSTMIQCKRWMLVNIVKIYPYNIPKTSQ